MKKIGRCGGAAKAHQVQPFQIFKLEIADLYNRARHAAVSIFQGAHQACLVANWRNAHPISELASQFRELIQRPRTLDRGSDVRVSAKIR